MIVRAIHAVSPPFVRRWRERVMASSLGGRLARGAFWSLFGTALSKVLSTLSWVVVGRLLGKTGFGEIGMIQNTVGIFGAAAGFGMGMAATKYVAEYRQTDPDRAGRFIALASAITWISSGVLAIVLVLLSGWLARETLAAPQLTGLLQVSGLLLLFSGVTGAQTGSLSGFEAFKTLARINVITGLLSFPLMVLGALWGDVGGALWGLIASTAIGAVLNWIALRRECRRVAIRVQYRGCWQESRVFWDFNLPGMLNTVFSAVVVWAVGAILVRHADGFGGLGIYNAVQRIRLIPENIAAMLLAPMLPILSASFGRRDMAAYGKTLLFAFVVSTVVIIPLALLQIAAPWLTLLPYGSEYVGGDPHVVVWVMAWTICYALTWPMGSILISMGRIWFALGVGILSSVINLGLSVWLIPTMGASGMALAAFLGMLAACVPCIVLLYRELPDLMHQIRWWTMLAVTFSLVAVCVAAFHWLTAAAAGGIGLAAAILFFVWRLHPQTNRLA
jgi:O-antigen/teichoic acid export membrane protein